MESSFFTQPGVVFGAAAGLSWLAHRLRAPQALFLLLFGAVLGVNGLRLWTDLQALDGFISVGIAALLFLVGLELSPAFFREVGARPLRIFAMMLVCLGGLGTLWASHFGLPMVLTVMVGVLFAFNSTMLALKTLGEREELGKAHGRIVTTVLVLQDVAASFVLVGVVLWEATQHEQAWTSIALQSLLKMGLLIIGCWLIATYVLKPFWRQIARKHDVFLLAGFAYPLFVGALFAVFGLSVELGALVAGVSLAHSEYRFELMTRMKPLREIFLAPFFLAIGASWAWRSLAAQWTWVALGVLILCVVGPLIAALAMRLFGYTRLTAFGTALHLSHGGEFTFLFLTVAAIPLHLPAALQSALLSTVILSMLGGSLLMELAPHLLKKSRQLWPERVGNTLEKISPPASILFGCHRVGSDFLPVLAHQKHPFLVVDMDPQVIEQLRGQGVQALYGDVGNRDLLEKIQLAKAKLIISTVPEVDAQISLLKYLKQHRSKAIVILVAHQVPDALLLYKQGASYVILPHFLGGNYASQLIDVHGYDDPEPFEVERIRHLEHLRRRGKSSLFQASPTITRRAR